MKRTEKKNILYNKFRTVFILFLIIILFTGIAFSSINYNKWGISKEMVKKELIAPDEGTFEFTPADKPDYENKIMNMVNLILKNVDSNVYERITIISTKGTAPGRDFLLLNNKLFSVKEYYKTLPKKDLQPLIKTLEQRYGSSNYNPGEEMDIFFISTKDTKIIVHYFLKTKVCEIYFYDSQLYHKLSSNDF
ncbi:MAG: hypothetical protein JW864_02190 [Spirochaetes bacterium]|nr:hypothetical protein [Spirochaetota bacterium]